MGANSAGIISFWYALTMFFYELDIVGSVPLKFSTVIYVNDLRHLPQNSIKIISDSVGAGGQVHCGDRD